MLWLYQSKSVIFCSSNLVYYAFNNANVFLSVTRITIVYKGHSLWISTNQKKKTMSLELQKFNDFFHKVCFLIKKKYIACLFKPLIILSSNMIVSVKLLISRLKNHSSLTNLIRYRYNSLWMVYLISLEIWIWVGHRYRISKENVKL